MERHPYFDLLLHTQQELENLLGGSLRERVTLHEWPLSCVQRLVLTGGQSWIYKAQCGPTVEPEFYSRARSPLLVQTRVLFRDDRYACLLLPDLKLPTLETCELSEEEAVKTGRQLLAEIAAIENSDRFYLDIGTWERWQALMDGMLEDLDGLVRSKKYEHTNREDLRVIARAAAAPEVRAVFDPDQLPPPGLVHYDLRAENVFRGPDGFRVIDWQRPIFGPPEIDLVLFLASLGYDPRRHVTPGVIAITDLLLIHWFTECAVGWFPEGCPTYDRTTAHLVQQLRHSPIEL